jgi:hypothetical protein
MRTIVGLCVAMWGCIAQVQQAVSPPATGGGTLTCREIVEQCDVQCGVDPLCIRRCGDQGTPEAARLHDAVVDCGQRHACTDLACLEANCRAEAEACEGAAP